MAKSRESFLKKEREKKRQKRKQEKLIKKEERRLLSNKGKKLEDMFVYVDENGNISPTPTDPSNKTKVLAENTPVSVARQTMTSPSEQIRKGTVHFFNSVKLYGFIRDHQSQENILFHQTDASEPLKQNDNVQYERQRGPKGWLAVNVMKSLP